MSRKFFSVVLLFSLLVCGDLQGQNRFTLHGTIVDAASGDLLAAANVRIVGTSRGTISNARGEFLLPIDSLPRTVVISYLAYKAETLVVAQVMPTELQVKLQPSPIQLPEVVVSGEDPALEIIRKAIAHKHEWMEKLKSYSFDAFTRQIVRRDSDIASITEAYTEGFQKTGDTLREIVKQRRQTQNIPTSENLAAVRRIVNFNDDRLNLFSMSANGRSMTYTFVGPTATDALDNYDYRLIKTSRSSGVDLYHIRMTPKSRLKPLFDGEIIIADRTFAVVGVDVRPNEAFTIPFVKDIDFRYRQQFNLYDSIFWMPTDIRIDGGLKVSIIGLSMPRVGISIVSSIYDYTINPVIPDTILAKPRLTVDSIATKFDSTFWSSNQVLPLTTDEQRAYRTLDSTQTLEKQFEPTGPLASLGNDNTGSWLDMLDVRYNRVEGFFFGGKKDALSVLPYLNLSGSAGIGFSDERFKYSLGATVFPFSKKILGVGGEWYTKLDNVPDQGYYGQLAISLMALIDKNDYRDYYLAKGGRVFVSTDPCRWLNAEMSFLAEQHYSLDLQSDYSIFSQSNTYRPNPAISDGKLRSVRLDLRLGDEPVPLDFVTPQSLEFSVEHSSPKIAGSEFDFTRYTGMLTWSMPTFGGDLLFPPSLRFRLSGGLGLGSLPPQREFVIDSRSSGYAPFGVLRAGYIKEFRGDRFVMLNVEHNFRSLPFLLLNLPFMYRNGIELIVHGSFAQTWDGTLSTSGGWYSEAGIGISRILDLLRADLTYRFKEPRGVVFSVCVATFF